MSLAALIDYAQADEVQTAVQSATEQPSVHGVIVELDPVWLVSWWWQLRGWNPDGLWSWLSEIPPYGDPFLPSPFRFRSRRFARAYLTPPYPLATPVDLNYRPPFWPQLRRSELAGPFRLRILRRPLSDPYFAADFVERFRELNIAVETRPLGELYARRSAVRPLIGGVSVGVDGQRAATLGGIVVDGAERRYAITCAHVVAAGENARQPALADDHHSQVIGRCAASSPLPPAGDAPCNPYSPQAVSIDAAALPLDEPSLLEVQSIGSLVGIAQTAAIDAAETVRLSGRSSGCRRLVLNGMAKSLRLRAGDHEICFADLIELRRRRWLAGPSFVKQAPVKPGDSGAWITRDGPGGKEWCGMVCGGDGDAGYAMLAERVADWLNNQGIGAVRVS